MKFSERVQSSDALGQLQKRSPQAVILNWRQRSVSHVRITGDGSVLAAEIQLRELNRFDGLMTGRASPGTNVGKKVVPPQ